MLEKIENVCFLASDNMRSRAYLQAMQRENCLPMAALVVGSSNMLQLNGVGSHEDLFDAGKSIFESLQELSIPTSFFAGESINSQSVRNRLIDVQADYVVYAGPPGTIIEETLLSLGMKFIHVHPGQLPEYRGSTVMYYSILAGDGLSATAIFLDQDIDTGRIIAKKKFPIPPNREIIDQIYDPFIRSQLLVEILKSKAYNGSGSVQVNPDESKNFYVIHPVLKHIAIL